MADAAIIARGTLLGLATRVVEGAVAWPAVSLGLVFGFVHGTWVAEWFRRPGG